MPSSPITAYVISIRCIFNLIGRNRYRQAGASRQSPLRLAASMRLAIFDAEPDSSVWLKNIARRGF